jgi:hypothetical protein
LVAHPEYDEEGEVIRGEVLFHSKDRDEMYRKDMELRPASAAYVFAGEIPDGVVIVL